MSAEARVVNGAVNSWKQVIARADKAFAGLSAEQLQKEVAPGKNRLIYLLGHLTAVDDSMFAALGLGERLHPELDAIFLSQPDRAVETLPSVTELQAWWSAVNARLTAAFAGLTAEDWVQKHALVSEEDFAKEPDRNRLAILLSRTNHVSFHLGQTVLART